MTQTIAETDACPWPLEIGEAPAPTGVIAEDGREIWLDWNLDCFVKAEDGHLEPYKPLVATPQMRYTSLQWIVRHHQCTTVEGVLVDLMTANLVLQVLKMLKPEQQRKLLNHHMDWIGAFAWRCVK